MSRRFLSLAAALAGTFGLAACTEQLESGAGCPLLCPQAPIELRDTILEAVIVDSTLAGFPALGFETFPLLANHGDTLETRVVVRFDSLPTTYQRLADTTSRAIVSVDSASLILRLQYPVLDSLAARTISAYDVDTLLPAGSVADTMVSTLRPLFRPDRFLGSVTFTPKALTDSTVRVPIASAALLDRIRAGKRLRIGLAIEGTGSVSVRLAGQGSSSTLALRFRAEADTATAAAIVVPPRSTTPNDALTAPSLVDYQVVFRSFGPPGGATLAVGGIPGRRTYLRFELPRAITDSTRIVRASLQLTQLPNPLSVRARDTLLLVPEVLVASGNITSLERAVRFTSRTFTVGRQVFGLFDIPVVPANGGLVTVEIGPLVAAWSTISADTVPRAIVLRAIDEGEGGATVLFHSREAAAALRPRLRLTYAPRLEFGLP